MSKSTQGRSTLTLCYTSCMPDVETITECFKRGNKLLIIGNGGSACEASHMAAEFLCRFEKERKPLPAIALTTDLATITAISNDYDFSEIFKRQIEALGKKGDILIVFTTSKEISYFNPHSINIFKAIMQASQMGLDVLKAPIDGDSTAQIQERQLVWLHDTVREVEKAFV